MRIVELKDQELEKVKGGAVPYIWVGIAIAALIVFISGVIDGITNPKPCN